MLSEVYVLVTQSYLTLCDPIDCSPPGSSVHRIFQARILECNAIFSPRGSPHLGFESMSPAGRFFTTEMPGKHNVVKIQVGVDDCNVDE